MEGLAPGVGGGVGGVNARVAWEDKCAHKSDGVGIVVRGEPRDIFSALIVKDSKGMPSPVWDNRLVQEILMDSSICRFEAAMRDMLRGIGGVGVVKSEVYHFRYRTVRDAVTSTNLPNIHLPPHPYSILDASP